MSNKKSEGILKGLNQKDDNIIKDVEIKKKNKTFNLTIEAIEIIDVIAYKNKLKKNEVLEKAIRTLADDDVIKEVNKRIKK